MNQLLNRVDWRCTVCHAKRGECDCFTKCPAQECKYSYPKGETCPNAMHVAPPYDVDCPHCGAARGQLCHVRTWGVDGLPLNMAYGWTHQRRDTKSRKEAAV